MGSEDVRKAVDAGDVDGLRNLLRDDPSLLTSLVDAPEIEPTSPLTYVGMVRFYGYAPHDRTGDLARVLLEAGADGYDVVRVLLAAGARVDLTDNPPDTALRVAAAYGWPAIVDMLIAAGAEPQSIIEAAGSGDISEWDLAALSDFQRACALRAAAVNERIDVIDQLLAAGTPIDAEVDDRPAIFWAREQGRSKAVAHLAARGAA